MTREFVTALPCDMAVARVTQALNTVGFRVERSFDLRSAIAFTPDCSCQHHGTAECDCQYVVLLVYERAGTSATLVVHGHDGCSWVMVVDNHNRKSSVALRKSIARTLSPLVSPE